MISVNGVTVEFGGFELLSDITFMINPRDRVGLTGKNGAGKSTMMKIIAGIDKPTRGEITMPGDTKIGYLPQEVTIIDTRSVFDETMTAFDEVLQLEKQIKEYGEQLGSRTDYESDDYSAIIHRLSEAHERYDMLGGQAIAANLETTLLGLGFSREDFSRQTSEFSGGWRMRIELAKILLKRPNLFLLDEPTNHLDIESIQWLEDFLKDYPGAVMLVSHDRAFLDNVTNRTVEIELGKVYDYKASYTDYIELRKERRATQISAYINQQKKIEDTEKFIERFRYKATKAVQVQSRIKQLDKIERIEIDDEDNSAIHIKFPPALRSGTVVVEAKTLSKRYDKHLVLNEIDLVIERGEKVAFVGKNGEGKTTFAKVLMGLLEHEGNCKIGHNVKIGYFAQNSAQMLDPNKTIFETIDHIAVGDIRTKIRDILGAFLFGGDTIDKKVMVLSGGERTRLALACLLLEPYSVLLLDEPTNHLDLRSKDILKQALKQYEGTVILISHDRDFLDGLVNKVYEFRNKKVKEHLGGIYDFLAKRKLENFKELERKATLDKQPKEEKASNSKLQYEERKEQEKKLRKIKTQIEKTEQKIESLELSIEDCKQKLSTATPETDVEALVRIFKSFEKQLELEMESWEKLQVEYEEAEKNKA